MQPDRFSSQSATLGQPATSILSVAPSDTDDLPEVVAALNVETPGRVTVTTKDGTVGSIYITAGSIFPLRIRRVWATGTTATGISGLI